MANINSLFVETENHCDLSWFAVFGPSSEFNGHSELRVTFCIYMTLSFVYIYIYDVSLAVCAIYNEFGLKFLGTAQTTRNELQVAGLFHYDRIIYIARILFFVTLTRIIFSCSTTVRFHSQSVTELLPGRSHFLLCIQLNRNNCSKPPFLYNTVIFS